MNVTCKLRWPLTFTFCTTLPYKIWTKAMNVIQIVQLIFMTPRCWSPGVLCSYMWMVDSKIHAIVRFDHAAIVAIASSMAVQDRTSLCIYLMCPGLIVATQTWCHIGQYTVKCSYSQNKKTGSIRQLSLPIQPYPLSYRCENMHSISNYWEMLRPQANQNASMHEKGQA